MNLFALAEDWGITSIELGPIILRGIPGTNRWLVEHSTPMVWSDKFGVQHFVIPEGMETDLATIPALLRPVVSPCGPIKEAAVGHDALYQYRPVLSNGQRIARAEADYWLYRACLDIALMPHDLCVEVFLAVRVGGSSVWHSHDKDFVEAHLPMLVDPTVIGPGGMEGCGVAATSSCVAW